MRENRPMLRSHVVKLAAAVLLMLAGVRSSPAFAGKKKDAAAPPRNRSRGPQSGVFRHPQDRVAESAGHRAHPVPRNVHRPKDRLDSLSTSKTEARKQKWMDRLAGTKPAADQIDMSKLPFQLDPHLWRGRRFQEARSTPPTRASAPSSSSTRKPKMSR